MDSEWEPQFSLLLIGCAVIDCEHDFQCQTYVCARSIGGG